MLIRRKSARLKGRSLNVTGRHLRPRFPERFRDAAHVRGGMG